MECPTCQRNNTIPVDGVISIPQNLHLGFEVEVAGYMSKIGSEGERPCNFCIDGGKGPAVVFCHTCHQFLCTFCSEYHKSCKHEIVGLDQKFMIPKKYQYLCSQPHHRNKELKLYCEDCQCLICGDCILDIHKGHKSDKVCNIAKASRDGMKEALVHSPEMTSKLVSAIDATDKMAEQDETLLLNQAFEQLHQAIAERKKALLSEMEAMSGSRATDLSLWKEQLRKMKNEIDRYTEMTSHILQTHTDHEVVALRDLLSTELKAILKKAGGVSLTPSQSRHIHVRLTSL